MADVGALKLVHDQEDVVDADCQDQEWDDFRDDKRSLHAEGSKQANTCRDRHEDDQDARHT